MRVLVDVWNGAQTLVARAVHEDEAPALAQASAELAGGFAVLIRPLDKDLDLAKFDAEDCFDRRKETAA